MSYASIQAYDRVLGSLSKQKRLVLQAIRVITERGYHATLESIMSETKLKYSACTGRLSDLWDDGLIMPFDETRKTKLTSWVLVDPDRRVYVQKMRKHARLRKWIKKSDEMIDLLPADAQKAIYQLQKSI